MCLLSGCATLKKMENPEIYFVTTDNKKYVLRTTDKLLTSNLPNGTLIYPNITLCKYGDLAGASSNAWEPTVYNVSRNIIPVMFSQYMYVNNYAAPGGRSSIYRFSTPWLIERGALPGKNTFPPKIAPYTREVNKDTSFYNPAGPESVAYCGSVLFEFYERVPFHSIDFKEMISPDTATGIPALTFDPTVNITAYTIQQQQTTPFPMRSPIPNDYNQLITIGYNPAFGGAVTVSVRTVFVYFELEG